ncbi:probable glucan 1,3-beta-glucosidase A [Tanacetum coccineum]
MIKMISPYSSSQLLGIVYVFAIFIISNGRTVNSDYQKIRAVNLGDWLVTEGWMKPSLFDTIPNNDLLLWRINGTSFHIRVFNKRFLGLDSNGVNLVAYSTDSELTSGIFEIIKKSTNSSLVRIKAPNGLFMQATSEELVTADSKGDGQWREKDPSVFNMSIAEVFHGEYQVTNGLCALRASKIMKNHWKMFTVEKDFDFIATSGLNAVRIPIGWWTARDPTPPKAYVGGSLHYLDKAFLWAKYAYLHFLQAFFFVDENIIMQHFY